MIQILYPYEYMESVFSIDYRKLYRKGYRGILFDIDMTLVPHGADATESVEELFREIQGIGLKTFLLTNNDEERVRRFLRNIDSPYICDAGKPNAVNYRKAVERLGIRMDEAVFIGDQIFIDIYGANRCGMASILVKYVCEEVETNIGIRRHLEEIVLWLYGRSKAYRHRLGDIHR